MEDNQPRVLVSSVKERAKRTGMTEEFFVIEIVIIKIHIHFVFYSFIYFFYQTLHRYYF